LSDSDRSEVFASAPKKQNAKEPEKALDRITSDWIPRRLLWVEIRGLSKSAENMKKFPPRATLESKKGFIKSSRDLKLRVPKFNENRRPYSSKFSHRSNPLLDFNCVEKSKGCFILFLILVAV
jgi:hypothetical protein